MKQNKTQYEVATLYDTAKGIHRDVFLHEYVYVLATKKPIPQKSLVFHNDDNTLTIPMIELVGPAGERALRADQERPRQFWDSIIRYPCGNLQLHNFPHTLRNLLPTDELGRTIPHPIDLAAVDLYRDRERGILLLPERRPA